MKRFIILIFVILSLSSIYFSCEKKKEIKDNVTFDFGMVEKGMEWLEYVESDAEEGAIRDYFMTQVAPTGGCQAIIHHWERFMKWNNDEFYKFIMAALGKIPSEQKIRNPDGSLTIFGRRRQLWQEALINTDQMKKDLDVIKRTDFRESLRIAKTYLPSQAVLEADFYFVLFGHSVAFSVGKENGYDFLQLSRKKDGRIDTEQIIQTFAHELHHTGFSFLAEQNHPIVQNEDRIYLLGILASEGMPTYFIDMPWQHLGFYRTHEDFLYRMLAEDWEKHTANLDALYIEAEKDMALNLANNLNREEILKKWVSGIKGAAYVLGADMFSAIENYLGREQALNVALDYRQFLLLYNRAVDLAEKKGKTFFHFSPDLAKKISELE